jgi:hypothetical protein
MMISLNAEGGFARFEGLSLRNGALNYHSLWASDGGPLPDATQAAAVIAALQASPPPLSQAPLNQIGLPDGKGLALTP